MDYETLSVYPEGLCSEITTLLAFQPIEEHN